MAYAVVTRNGGGPGRIPINGHTGLGEGPRGVPATTTHPAHSWWPILAPTRVSAARAATFQPLRTPKGLTRWTYGPSAMELEALAPFGVGYDALGFSLFSAITAPFKAVAKVGETVAKGAFDVGKFVVKHPYVAAPLALAIPGAPALVAGIVGGAAKTAVGVGGSIVKGAGTILTSPVKGAVAALKPSGSNQNTVAQTAGSGATVVNAAQVADVTGPTWLDALKQEIAQAGSGALNTFKANATNTILSQPDVQSFLQHAAKTVGYGNLAKAAVPSWVWPVALGGGALVLVLALRGSSR